MKEYRCTRNEMYSHNCLGHDDITARQGHFIIARDPHEARQKMTERFPGETDFTVQVWRDFDADKEGIELMEGLARVREDGRCNMFDRACVVGVLREFDRDRDADFLEACDYDDILTQFSAWLQENAPQPRESLAQRVARETGLELIKD